MGSCQVKIAIKARQRGQFLKKRLLVKKDKVIPLRSETMIPLLLISLLDDRDFLFHLIAQSNLMLFAYILYYDSKKILVRNISDRPLRILHYQRLGHIVGICYNNCFLADANFAFDAVAVFSQTTPFFKYKPSCTSTPTNPSMKRTLDN